MSNNPELDNLEKVVTTGFGIAAAAIRQESETTRSVARATYEGHTANGKARFVNTLGSFMGSSKAVADYLGLSESRVSQLRKRARRNGK
ncbi:sigma-70 family RNA polymerase sigma factor [Vibrio harveyi]|uniref:sigma-70 family RNA polymerase sigma factor n=1 Tax=Vibrio harveyi group TaxID=717610 RepID=UPI0002C48279|nr:MULTISPECIES: sigma-70 family RNA polymerase sigma factor [Vibrio harveyi group]EMR34588.1 hypothetical protein MUQ_22601 [Vibrio harveyi CAIM 1792]TOB33477.1 sigma-70 family RNA polymerase sigma factor [Vibrio parahaemolyticus]